MLLAFQISGRKRSATEFRRGTYSRLVDDGILHVSEGLRVQPISDLVKLTKQREWDPVMVVADRFRLPETYGLQVEMPGDR